MKDYLKFVEANYWNKNLQFGAFKYGNDKYICKFFLHEGSYRDYFVTSTRTLNMEKLYETKKFSTMSKDKIIKEFGEEFYNRYKTNKLTIKYLRNVEKNKSRKLREAISEIDNITIENI